MAGSAGGSKARGSKATKKAGATARPSAAAKNTARSTRSATTKTAARTTRAAATKAGAGPTWEGGWVGRVAFSGTDAIAFAPGQVLTTGGEAALEVARRRYRSVDFALRDLGIDGYQALDGVPDVVELVLELRAAGLVAQPNHVLFAHGGECGCTCPPHPAQLWGGGGMAGAPVYASPVYASPVYASPVYASPVYASPVYASPVYASPVYASPVYASPVYASPVYASPVTSTPVYASQQQATGRRPSSACPAEEPWITLAESRLASAAGAANGVSVVVLDTGLTSATYRSAAVTSLLPLLSAAGSDVDQPDGDADEALDAAAGHGTFIAGLIQQGAPGTSVALVRVLQAEGDGDEVQIAQAIDGLPDPGPRGALLNLSFGGYALDHPALLAAAITRAQDRGYVVVASAGNDGTCRPTFPAALPGVVSVGALGPNGPAPFSNYGPWVRACAPGVDLVSTFFANWDGGQPPTGTTDRDRYEGWACWSGTSFAAPVVVAALAHEMTSTGCTAAEAVTRLIDHPALLRIAHLGTVVNRL